jgi:hypothetical protein
MMSSFILSCIKSCNTIINELSFRRTTTNQFNFDGIKFLFKPQSANNFTSN